MKKLSTVLLLIGSAFMTVGANNLLNGNLTGEEYNIWAGDNITKLGETKVVGIHKGSTAFTSIFVKVDNIALKLNAHFK